MDTKTYSRAKATRCLFLLMAVLAAGVEARPEILCQEEGFSIVTEILPLDETQFTETGLREVFGRYAEEDT